MGRRRFTLRAGLASVSSTWCPALASVFQSDRRARLAPSAVPEGHFNDADFMVDKDGKRWLVVAAKKVAVGSGAGTPAMVRAVKEARTMIALQQLDPQRRHFVRCLGHHVEDTSIW